jgi:hypothetical protein
MPNETSTVTAVDIDRLIAKHRAIAKDTLPDVERVVNEAIAAGHKVPKTTLANMRKLGLHVPNEI